MTHDYMYIGLMDPSARGGNMNIQYNTTHNNLKKNKHTADYCNADDKTLFTGTV